MKINMIGVWFNFLDYIRKPFRIHEFQSPLQAGTWTKITLQITYIRNFHINFLKLSHFLIPLQSSLLFQSDTNYTG